MKEMAVMGEKVFISARLEKHGAGAKAGTNSQEASNSQVLRRGKRKNGGLSRPSTVSVLWTGLPPI
jgi:hypothetical protein